MKLQEQTDHFVRSANTKHWRRHYSDAYLYKQYRFYSFLLKQREDISFWSIIGQMELLPTQSRHH